MNIRVVSIQPGYFKSEISSSALKLKLTKEQEEIKKKFYPKFGTGLDSTVGPDPLPVAQKVLEAITVKRNWPSYIVEKEKIIISIFSLLPRFVLDFVRKSYV